MVHMVQQIKTFTHTSTEPYDRHTYKLVLNDGNAIEFDDYDQLKAVWFQRYNTGQLNHVIVQDNTQLRVSDSKGFG